jgi:uncharacterized protein (TIGR00297 family)
MPVLQLSLGFTLAALVSILAYRIEGLSLGGAWAATAVGGLIFALGGLQWAVLLLGFFISSSILSRAFAGRKKDLNEKSAKGSRRDSIQVLANGGVGALLAILQGFYPAQIWPWIAYAASMATVNADTWGTEIGVLSRHQPRLITTGLHVARGISGGITLMGTLAALGGALLIALLAALLAPVTGLGKILVVISLTGLAGSLFDSLLGAALQIVYRCPRCEVQTERHPVHSCGTRSEAQRGWRWMNNDTVNFLSAAFGAVLAPGLWQLH